MQIGTTTNHRAEGHRQRAKAGWFSRPWALRFAGCTALLCLPVLLPQTVTLGLMLWFHAVAAVSSVRIPSHVSCTSSIAVQCAILLRWWHLPQRLTQTGLFAGLFLLGHEHDSQSTYVGSLVACGQVS